MPVVTSTPSWPVVHAPVGAPLKFCKPGMRASMCAALFSVVEISCDAPEMVIATLNDCGPKPKGKNTPGASVTVKSHCVPAGVTSALSCRTTVKLPLESIENGPMVPWNGTWHGADPCPAEEHCCALLIVTVGWPVTPAPASTSCAFTLASE